MSEIEQIAELQDTINLAIGGIDALCLMTDNKPTYEDFQAIKKTLEYREYPK